MKSRPPWWMYLIAAIYALTFLFNARQEAFGPANSGWSPVWPSLRVASVASGTPMDKAGLQAGDTLESVSGQPLTGMPDWFLARAHFERGRPIILSIRRGDQQINLQLEITEPAWRSTEKSRALSEVAFCSARFILLLLALLVGFRRPAQRSARIAALMLAIGAVAEGYPSSGWAAALHRLPVVLALPICLATVSCLLSPLVWLAFFSGFPRPFLSDRVREILVFAPLLIFGVPVIASSIAMIYTPSILARPWPVVLSAAPVRLIQDTAGVIPLLFLNVLPAYQPTLQVGFLELWLAVSILYFAAGFFMLVANYRRVESAQERHRVGALCFALVIFLMIVAQNLLTRNWTNWFDSLPPAFLSDPLTLGATVLFLAVPLTLAYSVLAEGRQTQPAESAGSAIDPKSRR